MCVLWLFYVGVFGLCIEGGAGFGGEVAVAVDGGVGVEFAEGGEEGGEGGALLGGAGVFGGGFRSWSRGTPADIDDADGVGVVTGGVGSDEVDVATFVDGAVAVDDVVVADVGPALGFVP